MSMGDDDRFHLNNGHPYWNESSWMSFMAKDRELGGAFYFWHRPNMKLTSAGCFVWDGNGEEIYDCAHYDWHLIQRLAPDANMYDFRADNSVEVREIELGRKYQMRYDNNGCQVDVVWEAVMDPVDHSKRASGDVESVIEGWIQDSRDGIGHFEQGAWAKGTLVLRGEEIEIDGPACRDHSWGPRDLSRAQHCCYPWSVASPEHSFLVWGNTGLEREQDPILDTPMKVVGGWYRNDGVTGKLLSGTRVVTEHGPDGRLLRETIDAVDEHGRALQAEGRATATLRLSCWNDMFDWWTLAEWRYDGIVARGEMHEYFHFRPGHANLRRALAEKATGRLPIAAG
jgi:hypothetical protein